ncbi:hypothetical protein [Aureimonas pseudogalii]|uniref:Uncharacterized protein n=1 Tax=Aureimonas pseudogalii TaxID=1744844 RepID=A0A7W6H7U2_9HYPH|nr:hypothetical protein [Aureimonas pseudogalii]MBB4000203.1 hypothetical protein [Aureimonas pseudogalii]
MVPRTGLAGLLATLLLAVAIPSHARDHAFPAGAETMGRSHPSELMMRAPALLQSGKGEEATFWFYAGQLRWRSRLTADPTQDPTGEPALFSSLFETIGPEVNDWAFGNIPELQRTIDAVLDWDDRYPDPSLDGAVHAATRKGLADLRDQIGREADAIRTERAARGLANR